MRNREEKKGFWSGREWDDLKRPTIHIVFGSGNRYDSFQIPINQKLRILYVLGTYITTTPTHKNSYTRSKKKLKTWFDAYLPDSSSNW